MVALATAGVYFSARNHSPPCLEGLRVFVNRYGLARPTDLVKIFKNFRPQVSSPILHSGPQNQMSINFYNPLLIFNFKFKY